MKFINENEIPIKRLCFISPIMVSLLCGFIMVAPMFMFTDFTAVFGIFSVPILWIALIVWALVTGVCGLVGGFICIRQIIQKKNIYYNVLQTIMSLSYILISLYLINIALYGMM